MPPGDAGSDRPSGLAMDVFSKEARLDARMLHDDKPITGPQRDALIEDLKSYRDRNTVDKKPISWAKLAGYIGVTTSTLSEVVKGTYKGDTDRVLRMIDSFLASESQQGSRTEIRGFVKLKITEKIFGVIQQAVTRRSIAVVTGEPGSSKSMHARWFLDHHDGAILITSDDLDYDAKFIIDELHRQLGIKTFAPTARQKKREIDAYLQAHKNTVILVDEAQKLTHSALEMLRSLHDKSDPAGRRNVPVILFGDDGFYEIVLRSRGGQRTPLSPQITRRMFPVFSIERQCLDHDDDGQVISGTVYSKGDIDRIVRQQRLKIVRGDALAWLTKLANIHGHGRIGLAARVLEIGIDIARGAQVTIEDVRAALDLFLGPDEAKLAMEQMSSKAMPLMAATAG